MKKEEFEVLERLKNLEKDFSATKEDFDEQLNDHLLSINDNTTDCVNNLEYIYEVEQKVNKLNSRIDEIYLMLKEMVNPQEIILNIPEQKVFLTLYIHGENGLINTAQIARKCNVDESAIRKHIFDMMAKGVKITCEKVECVDYFKIDPRFKDLHATKGIVKISDEAKKELFNSNLSSYFVVN